jgi:catechol 2,3-dioxygenase-like lactoylglutathione lyase family enzyme
MRGVRRQGDIMTAKRMDNVGIVVEDIDAAIEFFTELGLEPEGRAPIEGVVVQTQWLADNQRHASTLIISLPWSPL